MTCSKCGKKLADKETCYELTIGMFSFEDGCVMPESSLEVLCEECYLRPKAELS